MPNHPNRSKAIEPQIKRLIEHHQLDRIVIETRDGKNFWAVAYPAHYHPIVAVRRKALLEKMTVERGRNELTIGEASEVTDKAYAQFLAKGNGSTIEEAVSALMVALTSPPNVS